LKKLTKYFASGLVFTLPIAITAIALFYVYDKLARCLRGPFVAIYQTIHVGESSLYELLPKHLLAACAEITTAVIAFLALAFIGWVISRTLRQCKDNAIHRFLENVPVIKSIFKPVNQAVQSLLGEDMKGRKVVRFAYPMEPYYGIGIVMDEIDFDGEKVYVVMMPLTMSAGTGVLLRIPQKRAKILDVDATTALEHVITCGMVPLTQKTADKQDLVTDVDRFWECIRQGQREIRFHYSQAIKLPTGRMSMRKRRQLCCRQMATSHAGATRCTFSDWLKIRVYAHWYYRQQIRRYKCCLEADGSIACFRRGN